jgi:quercetin dioxygenase-like cupin family protein
MTTGEHLDDPLTGQHLNFLQTGRDTGGQLLQVEVRLDPGGWVPRHAHVRQDERVEVLSGSLSMRVGGKERTLGVGESAEVPRRKVHVVRNAGDGEARFLLEIRPARRMEAAMRSLFRVMRLVAPLARLRRR